MYFFIVAVLLVVLIKSCIEPLRKAHRLQALVLGFNTIHCLPFPDNYKKSNSISTDAVVADTVAADTVAADTVAADTVIADAVVADASAATLCQGQLCQ